MSPKISEEAKILKRSYIIEKAMKIFSQKGFGETSMDDIVAATGVSKGGIYNYFKSKEEIFLAIAQNRFNMRHNLVENFPKNLSSKQKLMKYINWTLNGLLDVDTALNVRFTFEFWSVASRNEYISDLAKERYQLFYNDLMAILKEGISNGEFCVDLDVDSMVYIILSTIDGIAFSNSVMGIQITEEIIENYVDTILRKVLRRFENDRV